MRRDPTEIRMGRNTRHERFNKNRIPPEGIGVCHSCYENYPLSQQVQPYSGYCPVCAKPEPRAPTDQAYCACERVEQVELDIDRVTLLAQGSINYHGRHAGAALDQFIELAGLIHEQDDRERNEREQFRLSRTLWLEYEIDTREWQHEGQAEQTKQFGRAVWTLPSVTEFADKIQLRGLRWRDHQWNTPPEQRTDTLLYVDPADRPSALVELDQRFTSRFRTPRLTTGAGYPDIQVLAESLVCDTCENGDARDQHVVVGRYPWHVEVPAGAVELEGPGRDGIAPHIMINLLRPSTGGFRVGPMIRYNRTPYGGVAGYNEWAEQQQMVSVS